MYPLRELQHCTVRWMSSTTRINLSGSFLSSVSTSTTSLDDTLCEFKPIAAVIIINTEYFTKCANDFIYSERKPNAKYGIDALLLERSEKLDLIYRINNERLIICSTQRSTWNTKHRESSCNIESWDKTTRKNIKTMWPSLSSFLRWLL